jgi:hypothetical protein
MRRKPRHSLRTTFVRTLASTLLIGCSVADAPDDLEALLVFGFVHFGDSDTINQVTVEGLMPMTLSNLDELHEGRRVNNLGASDIEAVGFDPGPEPSILGATVAVELRSDRDQLAEVVTWPDMTEVLDFMLEWEVQSDTDRECFLEHRCSTYRAQGRRLRNVGIFGQLEQSFIREWRWLELEDQVVLLQRELNPDRASITSNLYVVDQQYAYSMYFEREGGTQRLDGYWVDAHALGMEVPDTFALDLAVNAIIKNAKQLDAFVERDD